MRLNKACKKEIVNSRARKLNQEENSTHRNDGLMSESDLVRKRLSEAAKSDACSLLDRSVLILKSSVDDGPELSDVGFNELRAALRNGKSQLCFLWKRQSKAKK